MFQNLIYLASFNPEVLPLGSEPCGVDPTAPCHIWWGGGGRHKAYTSVILIGNGLSFLCQSLIFLIVGSLADYGNWNPWVVRTFSVLTWAFEFGFLGIKTPDKWQAAMGLYIISSACAFRTPITTLVFADSNTGITWWASYVFFNAVFPKLADDLPEVHRARQQLENGEITEEEYGFQNSIARSKVMNISWVWNNVGFIIVCALTLGALFGVHANDGTAQNNWGYSISVAISTGFWIVLAIPWFLWEKRRPGPAVPAGDSYFTFGFKQLWFTVKQAWKLKQTFLYLISFFLLADGVGTTTSLVAIAQTQTVLFSVTENTYLILVQGGSAMIFVALAFTIQRRFKIRTKTMLQVSNFFCLLLPLWGMIGIWTTKVGYHNLWEFWLFAGIYGFTLGTQFSYGQAFMAELVPRGREYMFFSLLGIVSKGSSWIGPIVSSAIVDDTGNQWTAFPWVAALIFVPWVAIFFISEEKSKQECAEYLANEAKDLRKVHDA